MTREPRIFIGERIVSSKKVLGKLDNNMQNKIGPLTYTTHKKFTWNGLITKHKTETINALRKNIGEKLLDIGLGNIFFGYDTKSTSTKKKSSATTSIEKLVFSKRNN